jgi:hypothetical protein
MPSAAIMLATTLLTVKLQRMTSALKRFSVLARKPAAQIAVGAAVSTALIVGAAVHDEDGLFGANTAAWAQAVGSVAAIVAAIAIDQGTARRARRAVKDAERDARDARRMAIRRCVTVLNGVISQFKRSVLDDGRTYSIAPEHVRAIRTAQQVISHFVERGSNDDAHLVATLLTVEAVLQKTAGEIAPFNTPADRTKQLALLESGCDAILAALRKYEGGIW